MVGIAIVVLIGARVPFGSFRDSMARGPHVQLVVFDVVITAIVLGTESIATWLALIAVSLRRRFVDVLVVRGATYLLFLVNYALGQGGFGFYLHRTGTGAQTAVGATLFMIGTNLATLLLLTSAAWAIDGGGVPNAALWWTLTIGCGGFAAYLVVIVAAPAFLAGRVWLAPLFDAGLRGHAIAVLGRVPHIVFIVFSQWLAMRIWGLQVPVSEAMTVVPAIAIAAALPISPGGLGTTQAATVYFFSQYAVGATADDRAATVLAFSIAHLVYSVMGSIVVGMVCIPLARRIGAIPTTSPPSAA